MASSRLALRIHVLESVDRTRAERDAHSLRDDLGSLDGVDVAFTDDLSPEPGAKGPGLSPEIVLAVMVGSTALGTVTAVQAWVERSAKRADLGSYPAAMTEMRSAGTLGDLRGKGRLADAIDLLGTLALC
jgi:hypothetical protein